MSRVVVVGAGLGGLSAACHLAGAGHEVVVVEKDSGPGGRAGRLELGGYRFDTGPTVLTMPGLLEGTFAAAGAEMDHFLKLKRVDPMYRAKFADGSVVHVRYGAEAMAEEIRATCGPHEAAGYERFTRWLGELYRLELGSFIDRNYRSPLDLARPLGPALNLARLGALRRLTPKVRSFFRDDRLVRLFTFQSMYAGLAPSEALAVFGVITYMDTVAGVYFPEGGMSAMGDALALAAQKAGATFIYDCAVERIVLADGTTGRVRGARLTSGEMLDADAVVCNVDLPTAYRRLLPGLEAPRAAQRGTYSPSALVWHMGAPGPLPAGTAHHNIFFGRQWDESFRELLKDGRPMSDPSVLVSVPTVDEPSLAPAGAHTFYVLEPVPNLDGRVDWSREKAGLRSRLARRMVALGFPAEPEVETLVGPDDWERMGMERGTPFGLAHRFFQSGPFRPPNFERRAPGLIFTGSNTVPGVGVPMVLLSGKLAAARVGGTAT